MSKTQVSVIIPTMKGREDMLNRLKSTIPAIDLDIVVVDDEDMLLAAKRNKGATLSKGKYLFFIDDDNYLEESALEAMLDSMNESIGVMGMTACYDDKKMLIADGGSKRNYINGFTNGLRTNDPRWKNGILPYPVDEVANAFMIERNLFFEVGGFDEDNFPIDLDEADICKRIKNMGYRIMMNPRAICYHNSQTYSHIPDFRRPMNAYFMGRNRILFQKKHLGPFALGIYFALYFPIFYLSYAACLLYRRKPMMVYHFTRGVLNGIFGKKQNKYQSH